MAGRTQSIGFSQSNVLREAFREMDLESYEADPVRPLTYVARLNRHLNHQTITSTLEHLEREAGPGLLSARERLVEMGQTHEEHAQSLRRRNQALEEWKELGLEQRISLVHFPKFIRYVLMVFLTGLDFNVFAKAMAVVQDLEDSPTNAAFWIGGAIGLFVSLVAFFLGHYVKKWSMAQAQLELGREIHARNHARGIVQDLPRRSTADKPMTIGLAVLFALALAFSALMRFQAANGENVAVIAFQLLIPVLIAVMEYSMFDPIEIRRIRVPRKVRALRAEVAQREAGVSSTVTRMQRTIGQTNAAVGAVREQVIARLQRHALDPTDEVLAKVAHTVDTDPNVPSERELEDLMARVDATSRRFLGPDHVRSAA